MENFDRNKLTYNNKGLCLDGMLIENIIKDHPTPFYLYSEETLIHNFDHYINDSKAAGIDSLICFALKSNSNTYLLKLMAKMGAGADIVSGGELLRAIEAGISPNKIVFSGVGKTKHEIELALSKDIFSFNVESLDELNLINNLAKESNKTARVTFRINPRVHAKTHKHISTGYKTHKFGMLVDDVIAATKDTQYWSNCKLVGLSVHIGSQLICMNATTEAIKILCKCAVDIGRPLEFLDVGGGLGVNYEIKPKDPAPGVIDYMNLVSKIIKENYPEKIKIVFEPGRRIIASVGFFITSVIRRKESENNHFLIVDGGMNDFVRPSLYEAYHEIYPSYEDKEQLNTDIVGPICETADCFGHDRMLPILQTGDFVSIADAGAYGYSMSSTYNMRARPGEVLITKDGEVINISS